MSKTKQTPPSDLEKFLPNPHASMVENHATRNTIITEINQLSEERKKLVEEMRMIDSKIALLLMVRQMHDALQANGTGKFAVCLDELDGLIQSLTNLGLCAEKVNGAQNLVVSIRKGA